MTPDRPRSPVRNIALFLVGFLLVIGTLTHFFGRPQRVRHRYVLAFVEPPAPDAADATLAMIRDRLDELAEPDWNAAAIRLPGDGIELTVTCAGSPEDLVHWATMPARCTLHILDVDRERVKQAVDTVPPEGQVVMQFLESCDGYNESTGEPIRRLYPKLAATPPAMAIHRFAGTRMKTKGIAKYVHLRLTFEPGDVERMCRLSEEHAGKPLGLVVDGIIRVITRVGPPPKTGSIAIVDLLDIPEMEKLAVVLRHGPLPSPVAVRTHEMFSADDGTPIVPDA
jgi:preprotein translocase subunit SecD